MAANTQPNQRVAEMTVDELREMLRELVQAAVKTALHETTVYPKGKRPPLDFPVNDLGPWPAGLTFRREEMYGDDAR